MSNKRSCEFQDSMKFHMARLGEGVGKAGHGVEPGQNTGPGALNHG